MSITIRDSQRHVVKQYDLKAAKAGINSLRWNLRYPGATVFPGIILEGPVPAYGPLAVPGDYDVSLTVGEEVFKETLTIEKDPRSAEVSLEDLQAQFDLAIAVRDLTSLANQDVIDIRKINEQIEGLTSELSGALLAQIKEVADSLQAISATLYQVRNQSPKDKIAFPIKLNNRLSGLYGFGNVGDQRPPISMYEMKTQLEVELMAVHAAYEQLLKTRLSSINENLKKQSLPIISY